MMRRAAGVSLLLILLAVAAWVAWPSVKAPLVGQTDAGARVVGNSSSPNADPTATGAVDVAAPGAVMIAIQSKSYRRAFDGSHALVSELPIGEYDAFATGADGSAHAKVALTAGATAHVELKLTALPGAVVLSGTVRDILGGTVAGAEVWVDFTIGRTNENGEFEARISPGEHEVRVRAPGYAEATERVTLRIDHRIELVLHPAATLRGIVVHADGAPAEGARVTVSGHDAFEAFSDAEGKFALEGLSGGSFDVRASTATEIGIADHVAVAPAGTSDVRIELVGAISVSGRILGADGAAIAGAKVILEGERHATERETVSGADGSYRFSPVVPGSIGVKACAEGYLCSTSPSRYVVEMPATPLDVVLRAGSKLRLRILDANGAPVAHAQAYLGEFEECESNVEGDCVIDHLQPRRTKLTVDHPTAGHVSDEVLDIGPDETRHTVRLVRGGTVRGTVRWDDGKPAANVEVSDGMLATRSTTLTTADGRYELVNVSTKYAYLRVQASARAGRGVAPWTDMDLGRVAEKTMEVPPGEVRDGVDFVLRRTSKTIAGTVVDANGAPVANAAIGLFKESEYFRVTHELSTNFRDLQSYAGADGTFLLENVADAEFIVSASVERQPRGIVRHVKAGAANVVVKLPAGANVEGVVKDARGAPIRRFDVRVDGSVHAYRVFDAAGRFTLNGLSEGKHRIAIEGALEEAGATCVMEVEAKALETTHAECTLERSVTVTARILTWPDRRPIAGVRIVASGMTVQREAEPSDADGRIRIEGVAPGEVDLLTVDALAHIDGWQRTVGRASPFDLGELSVAAERGYTSIRRPFGLADVAKIVSVDGVDVSTLGDHSLSGVLESAREGAPIVGTKPNGETITILRPAHRHDDP